MNNIFHESCTRIESTFVTLETFDIKVLINREGAEQRGQKTQGVWAAPVSSMLSS